MSKLTDNQKQLLRLIARSVGKDGWAPVSIVLWNLICTVPDELLLKEPPKNGGRCQFTTEGDVLMRYT